MALVTCRECKHTVSDTAASCPSCGVKKPVLKSNKKTRWCVILLTFLAIGYFTKPSDNSSNKAQDQNSLTQQIPAPGRCNQEPFEVFEVGRTFVSGEISKIVDRVCPGASWKPDLTIHFSWKDRAYTLTTEKLPYDGVAAQYRIISLRAN